MRTKYLDKYYRVYKDKIAGGGCVKIRTCLGCGKEFKSKGNGNRICYKCSRKELLDEIIDKKENIDDYEDSKRKH